jgi:hypothetical protein
MEVTYPHLPNGEVQPWLSTAWSDAESVVFWPCGSERAGLSLKSNLGFAMQLNRSQLNPARRRRLTQSSPQAHPLDPLASWLVVTTIVTRGRNPLRRNGVQRFAQP